MKPSAMVLLAALTLVIGGMKMLAQSRADMVEAHVAAAKAAAGEEHTFLFNNLCAEPAPATQQDRHRRNRGLLTVPNGTPSQ